MRQGYIDPVVSKENTISTGPPGGGGAAFLDGVASSIFVALSVSSIGSVFAEERLGPFFPFAGVAAA